jgi:hypothetical protein
MSVRGRTGEGSHAVGVVSGGRAVADSHRIVAFDDRRAPAMLLTWLAATETSAREVAAARSAQIQ